MNNIQYSHLFSSLNTIIKNVIRYYTPRRAVMYVPGNDIRKLDKAFKIDVDCIVMDCEDGVAITKKESARETLRSILDKGKPVKQRKYDWAVRVNSVDSGLCEKDLSTLLTAKFLPDTVFLPKVDHVDHLQLFSEQVNKHIKDNEKIDLVIYIESAIAMIKLLEICETALDLSKKSKFIPTTLVFGSDDFCANIGATRTEDSVEILYARQKLVMLAKAFNLQAIDMVYIQYKDLGLKKNSEQGAKMGYTGKQVIHPDQVPIVQTTFLPNKKQIEWAIGLLAAFEEHQKNGKGAFIYMGSMIDMPTMKQAQNIVHVLNITSENVTQ